MEREEIVRRLNELLAGERAGVYVANKLAEAAGEGDPRHDQLKTVAHDEAWSCAGLHSAVLRLQAEPVKDRSGFADLVLTKPGLDEQLELLNKGQAWVLKRIDELLAADGPDGKTLAFLREMRDVHVRNIELLA